MTFRQPLYLDSEEEEADAPSPLLRPPPDPSEVMPSAREVAPDEGDDDTPYQNPVRPEDLSPSLLAQVNRLTKERRELRELIDDNEKIFHNAILALDTEFAQRLVDARQEIRRTAINIGAHFVLSEHFDDYVEAMMIRFADISED